MTTFAYLRVSTDRQDVAHQRHGRLEYANTHGLGPLRFVEDTSSGRVAWRERAIGQLLSVTATPGDVVLFAEISRMAGCVANFAQRIVQRRLPLSLES